MRAAGCDHGIEKRLVMWGLIWLPRPRMKRPPEYAWRSQPMLASVIGLRAKATAMRVPSSTVSVCSAASSSGKNGSWLVSAVQMPRVAGRPPLSAAAAALSSRYRCPRQPSWPGRYRLDPGQPGALLVRPITSRASSRSSSSSSPVRSTISRIGRPVATDSLTSAAARS